MNVDIIISIKNLLAILITKQFFIGIVVGIFLTIVSFIALCFYWEAHPLTDCDSCIESATP